MQRTPESSLAKSEMTCDTCGSKLLPRANYCHFCGKKLSTGPGYAPSSPGADQKGRRKKERPIVRRTPRMGGGSSAVFGCLSVGLTILLVASLATIAWGVLWYRGKHLKAVAEKEEILRADAAAAAELVTVERKKRDGLLEQIEDEKKKTAEVEKEKVAIEKKTQDVRNEIAELERTIMVESRLRKGAESYLEGGAFVSADEVGSNPALALVADPLVESNQALALIGESVFSSELFIPEDIEAVRVRFRAFIKAPVEEDATGEEQGIAEETEAAGEEEADTAGEGEEADTDESAEENAPAPGILRVRLSDRGDASRAKEVRLLPSEGWLEFDIVFNAIEGLRRRFSIEAEGFPGEVLIDDIAVVDAYPMELPASLYQYYNSPAEKIYYYTSLQLQAAHGENIEVQVPRVTKGRVALSLKLNGEEQIWRFSDYAIEEESAQVTATLVGGNTLVYKIARKEGDDEVWEIIEVLDGE